MSSGGVNSTVTTSGGNSPVPVVNGGTRPGVGPVNNNGNSPPPTAGPSGGSSSSTLGGAFEVLQNCIPLIDLVEEEMASGGRGGNGVEEAPVDGPRIGDELEEGMFNVMERFLRCAMSSTQGKMKVPAMVERNKMIEMKKEKVRQLTLEVEQGDLEKRMLGDELKSVNDKLKMLEDRGKAMQERIAAGESLLSFGGYVPGMGMMGQGGRDQVLLGEGQGPMPPIYPLDASLMMGMGQILYTRSLQDGTVSRMPFCNAATLLQQPPPSTSHAAFVPEASLQQQPTIQDPVPSNSQVEVDLSIVKADPDSPAPPLEDPLSSQQREPGADPASYAPTNGDDTESVPIPVTTTVYQVKTEMDDHTYAVGEQGPVPESPPPEQVQFMNQLELTVTPTKDRNKTPAQRRRRARQEKEKARNWTSRLRLTQDRKILLKLQSVPSTTTSKSKQATSTATGGGRRLRSGNFYRHKQKNDDEVRLVHRADPDRENGCCCGEQFRTNNNLERHINYYNEDWKFKCNYCDKRFFITSYLRRHQVHTHPFERPLPLGHTGCKGCGQIFATKRERDLHHKFRECTGARAKARSL